MKLKDIVDFESLSYNITFGNLENQEKRISIILSGRNDIIDGMT